MRKLLLIAPKKIEFEKYIPALEAEGFSICFEENPRRAREKIKRENFVGVLISYQNNWFTCFEICAAIKHISRVPTCVLSQYQDQIDAICAMRRNALYLPISSSPIYVAMFMKVLADEYRQWQIQELKINNSKRVEKENIITIDNVHLFDELQKVYIRGEEIECTGYPYEILKYLMINSPCVCSYEEIFRNVWQEEPYGKYEILVRVTINKLRKLLKHTKEDDMVIENVRKKGYRIVQHVVI